MRRTLILGLSLFALHSYAGSFSRSISQQINKKIPEASVGIIVIDAKSGRTLYSYNQDHALEPASNTKIFTAAAALKELGNNYQFKTTVAIDANQLKSGTLKGNAYFKFTGDPSFKRGDLDQLVRDMKAAGVRRIKGNLILDSTRFSGSTYALGWLHDDLAYCYAAPVESVIINQNCMHFSVNLNSKNEPYTKRQGDAAGFKIDNHLDFVSGKGDPKTCIFNPQISQSNKVSLNGCLPARKNWNFTIAVANPNKYATRLIEEELAQYGISLTGQVKLGKQPRGLKTIASHSSAPLNKLVDIMLTYSNNVYAGALTKALGYKVYGVGSNKAGVNAIEAITAKMNGRGYKHLTLEDGAGGSRYNLITPREISRVLRSVYLISRLKNDFMNALPQSGMSGTLSYRMNRKPLLGRVHAKTGSMSGVSTLSGYVKDRRGRPLIFSIMMNGLTTSLPVARRVQDSMVKSIYQRL